MAQNITLHSCSVMPYIASLCVQRTSASHIALCRSFLIKLYRHASKIAKDQSSISLFVNTLLSTFATGISNVTAFPSSPFSSNKILKFRPVTGTFAATCCITSTRLNLFGREFSMHRRTYEADTASALTMRIAPAVCATPVLCNRNGVAVRGTGECSFCLHAA